MENTTRKLTIATEDLKECEAYTLLQLFQLGLYAVHFDGSQDGIEIYYPKKECYGKLKEVIMDGIQKNSSDCNYSDCIVGYGESLDNTLRKALSSDNINLTPRRIFQVITGALFRQYGEFY